MVRRKAMHSVANGALSDNDLARRVQIARAKIKRLRKFQCVHCHVLLDGPETHWFYSQGTVFVPEAPHAYSLCGQHALNHDGAAIFPARLAGRVIEFYCYGKWWAITRKHVKFPKVVITDVLVEYFNIVPFRPSSSELQLLS